MEAGFAKIDITPERSVPLAGYFGLKPRMSNKVRDRLHARAIALKDKDLTILVLIYDLLMTTPAMFERLENLLKDTNAKIFVIATHTHSAPGGIWNSFVPKLALGPYIPGMLEKLCEKGEQAARLALEDLSECKWSVISDRIPELAKNRRDINGPVDDGFWALRFNRAKDKKGNAILAGFGGHPVIVAEREPNTISADFPGEVVRLLEEQVEFAAFINGALGGVDVLFPDEKISADENLMLQSLPIFESAIKTKSAGLKLKSSLKYAERVVRFSNKPDAKLSFDDMNWKKLLFKPLELLANNLFYKAGIDGFILRGFSLNNVLFIATPADLGASLAISIKNYAMKKGFDFPFAASQSNGYVGYVHRRMDYRITPDKATRGMAIYENAMGIFGHEAGEVMLESAREIIDELSGHSN